MGGPCGFQAELHSAKAMKTAVHGTGLETQSINTFQPGQSVLRAGGVVAQYGKRVAATNAPNRNPYSQSTRKKNLLRFSWVCLLNAV